MIKIIATNITSPIGYTTEENYSAVRREASALREMDGYLGIQGHFCVGAFSIQQRDALKIDGFSWFESLVIRSVKDAIQRCSVNVSDPRIIFVIGTSTAGIEELGATPDKDGCYLAPGLAAKKISSHIGFVNNPVLVSNACVSGATAQMMAARLISTGLYDSAVVCGADVLSAFVIAGFSSFKSLSPVMCRPFDIERMGLNIGECAATMILSVDGPEDAWGIVDGCLNNDAYHVSAPIPNGDGVRRSMENILTPQIRNSLACISAHGTATMFNDQMESKAIETAGLSELPTMALKPHFGHTFGASGVVESIITMCALDEGILLPVLGFDEIGVSGKMNICKTRIKTDKKTFIKVQSGFGGCNGSIVYSREHFEKPVGIPSEYKIVDRMMISSDDAQSISDIYKEKLNDGPKFYKMDSFSRLVYVAATLVLEKHIEKYDPTRVAMVIFTLNGSVLADRKHLSTFSNPDEFYPSPAVFINTLPNVVLGEIATRNNIKGETTIVILPEHNEEMMKTIIESTLSQTNPQALICGWVDCEAEDKYCADLKLYEIKN